MPKTIIDGDLFEKKINALENHLIPNKGKMDCYGGDIGDEVMPTFLKAMSYAGGNDTEFAERLEKWLKKNKVKHKRFELRKFEIDTHQFYNALVKDETLKVSI